MALFLLTPRSGFLISAIAVTQPLAGLLMDDVPGYMLVAVKGFQRVIAKSTYDDWGDKHLCHSFVPFLTLRLLGACCIGCAVYDAPDTAGWHINWCPPEPALKVFEPALGVSSAKKTDSYR